MLRLFLPYVAPPGHLAVSVFHLNENVPYKVLCSELKKSDIGDWDVYLFVKTFTSSQYLCLIQTTPNVAYKYSDGDCQMGDAQRLLLFAPEHRNLIFSTVDFVSRLSVFSLCLAFVIIVVGRAGHLYLDASQGPLPSAPG